MALQNQISEILTQQTIDNIKQLISQIDNSLPFLLGLTSTDRKRLPKINKANKLFVEDTLQAAGDNSQYIPSYVDVAELQKDLDLFVALGKVLRPLEQLYEKVRDTQMLAGSEAFQSSLAVYQIFQLAAKTGQPGMDTVVQQLAQRFMQGTNTNSSNTGEEETTPPVG